MPPRALVGLVSRARQRVDEGVPAAHVRLLPFAVKARPGLWRPSFSAVRFHVKRRPSGVSARVSAAFRGRRPYVGFAWGHLVAACVAVRGRRAWARHSSCSFRDASRSRIQPSSLACAGMAAAATELGVRGVAIVRASATLRGPPRTSGVSRPYMSTSGPSHQRPLAVSRETEKPRRSVHTGGRVIHRRLRLMFHVKHPLVLGKRACWQGKMTSVCFSSSRSAG